MKKLVAILLCFLLLSIGTGCSAEENITGIAQQEQQNFVLTLQIGNPIMTVNGTQTEIDPEYGTVPILQNDRTLVPIRAVIEAMGGTADWNEETDVVALLLNGIHFEFMLSAAPAVINGRAMLPIRMVAENFQFDVEWENETQTVVITKEFSEHPESAEKESQNESPMLLYMGQASLRIITEDGKVIYIDPFAGQDSDYLPSADLILITHSHFDHCDMSKIKSKNDGCITITQTEALQGGVHNTFSLGFVTVEAVEAGFNQMHDARACVGYVLTFRNGKSVYVTGDTSTTEQMPKLRDKQIDYAFYCTDGVFNMDNEEAARCAAMVGAKHNIPYHNDTSNSGQEVQPGKGRTV